MEKNIFTKVNIMFFTILCFFVIVNKFLYLFELPFAGAPGSQILSGAFAILAFILSIIFSSKISLDKYSKWIIMFLGFIIVEWIISAIRYPNESIIAMFKEHLYFFTFLIYFIFKNWIYTKEKFIKLFELITVIVLLTNVLLIINAFLYNQTGHFLLKIMGVNYGTIKLLFRSNGIRIYNVNAGLGFISAIISSGIALGNKQEGQNRILHTLNLITTIFSIYYIEQSRLMLLIIIVAVLCVLVNSKNISRKRKLNLYLLMLIFVLFIGWDVISQTGKSILESLADSSDVTSANRFEEITYYLSVSKSHPLFGLGLISATGSYGSLVSGTLGNWTYTDVGVFGILGKLGFVGLFMYLYLLLLLAKETIKYKLPNSGTRLGIVLSIFLSSITMSFFDSQRIVGLVLAMMYFIGTATFYRSEEIDGIKIN